MRARQHAVAQPEQRLAGTARDLSANAGDHPPARARPGRLRPESDRLLQPGTAVLPHAQDHGRRPLLLRRAVSDGSCYRLAGGMGSFPFASAPCDASVFLLQRFDGPACCSRRHAEERLVGEDVTITSRRRWKGRAASHGTHGEDYARRHARLAGRSSTPDEAASRRALPRAPDHFRVAASLAVSRFQLSRMFREWTGFSLLGYQNQLRVRPPSTVSDPNVGSRSRRGARLLDPTV